MKLKNKRTFSSDFLRHICQFNYEPPHWKTNNLNMRKQRRSLCVRYTDSTIPLLPKKKRNFRFLAVFCDCTGRFVSDLVENPDARFSRVLAHITMNTVDAAEYVTAEIDATFHEGRGKWRTIS